MYGQKETKSKSEFIEFVVDGNASVELFRKINFDFQANSDFQVTRLDIPSERFFGILKSGKSIDLDWFIAKFKEYGLTIHCINTGFVGEKEFQHLSKKDCQDLNKH